MKSPMNPSEELKAIKKEIDKLHDEVKMATLGKGEYDGISKEDRKEILVVLNSQLAKLEAEKKSVKEEMNKRTIKDFLYL
jgi:hypothetical protein